MTPDTAAKYLEMYLDADIPVMLWGAPGVGKSDTVRSISTRRKCNIIDFRASTRDPVALMGIPAVDGPTTRWKVPDEFPQEKRDGKEGILFLDELNAAPPSMQAAMFGFVLDRRVGEYVLPKGWRIIAAGNRQSDKAAAQRMPTALADRFAHLDVDVDAEQWATWAAENKINPMIIAFLRFRPTLLHQMPEGSDNRTFPTPRSWAAVSKVLGKAETAADRFVLASSLVGEGPAAELNGFFNTFQKLPSLASIFADPKGAKLPDDPGAKYAVAIGLANAADTPDKFEAAITYTYRVGREFNIMMVMDALRRHSGKGLDKCAAWVTWCKDNQDVTFN